MAGATAKSQPKASKVDRKELARLERKTYWLGVTRTKLVMDFIFVCAYCCPLQSTSLRHVLTAYDVFGLKRGKDTVQSFVGLVAAILGCVHYILGGTTLTIPCAGLGSCMTSTNLLLLPRRCRALSKTA